MCITQTCKPYIYTWKNPNGMYYSSEVYAVFFFQLQQTRPALKNSGCNLNNNFLHLHHISNHQQWLMLLGE